MDQTQYRELGESLTVIKNAAQKHSDKIGEIEKSVSELYLENSKLKKLFAQRGAFGGNGTRPRGGVSDQAARAIGAHVILSFAKKGLMDNVDDRDVLIREARAAFNLETKAALTTSDVALPTEYTQELKELMAEYGICRRVMTPYPIGRGTSKPARLGTQDDFTFPISMSSPLTEKNVKLGSASLESHKGGGLIRIPREIDEQGIIPLGQMLARYAARKFGKTEDAVGFLGDGTGTYDSIKGVCQIAVDNSKVTTLGATKTAPSDATLTNIRSLRALVATPVIGSGVYYFHNTWESRLRDFNTTAAPNVYVQVGPRGRATLDGYDIVWTEVMQPYTSSAAASTYVCVFGDLSYWWFGEHGQPRTDFSTEVFFTTDEIAIRWLEEIDFDYAAPDCAAVLRTAAA